MDEQYQYRHFTQVNGTEWEAPGGVAIWKHRDVWSIHRIEGPKIIERYFSTAKAAIDAYWNLPELEAQP